MTYNYTTNTLADKSGIMKYHPQTISSGIRPVTERGKWAGPVFVRVKASSGDKDKLEVTMKALCNLLNCGELTQDIFKAKTIGFQNARDLVIDLGYIDLLR